MSTILKALQRLEEEKAASAPRGLREELAAARPSRSRARRWLPGVVLIACLALGIVWWGWPRAAAPPLPQSPVAQQSPAREPDPVRRPTPAAARVVEPEVAVVLEPPGLPERGMPEQAFSSSVEVVARPVAKSRIPLEEPAAPIRAAPRAEPDAPAEGVAPVAPAPVPTREASAPKPAPLPPAVASTSTPLPPTPREPAPEPATDSVARLAPPLRVEKTLWHPHPQRREALVAVGDGVVTRIHEGELIAGVRVAEIQPSGVVFEREGERIRRRVGEP